MKIVLICLVFMGCNVPKTHYYPGVIVKVGKCAADGWCRVYTNPALGGKGESYLPEVGDNVMCRAHIYTYVCATEKLK